MLTYAEALERVGEGERPSVILGNGFSRAWRDDIFNYANLLDAANFGPRDDQIRELFRRLDTYDFEAVMRCLVSARTVLESYGDGAHLGEQIRADEQGLKDALIAAIAQTHPERPWDVTNDQYSAVRSFLCTFASIFTLNYDLLLYWSRNVDVQPPLRTDDGFRRESKWLGYGTNQQVHFLHGGLHIFDSPAGVKKHTFDGGGSIIDQVRDNLNEGRFPLFVSEPTSKRKLARIEHNPYLNFCYRALSNLNGTVFVLGHSIDENDKHIFDAVKNSAVSQIFMSLYGDERSDANTRSKANALAYLGGPGRLVEFFDAATSRVWEQG
ncbi:DUF4917 family protein [Duganella sp. Root198D2]|uniref:DUF4917 family protein n=1 Tax=Duganella sp. Root198D2 TaxID=1736489 RepID=UPI00070FBDFA|nr:DUF4917 family protein [Duganella sp. Root198D2]KRB97284.1 hypothetical protein ASE26_04465 [Duganella sp. Root198D2]